MADDPELEVFVNESLRRSSAMGYPASIFRQMRERWGTREAMRRLVISGDIQSGFRKLCELGLKQWSVEGRVIRKISRLVGKAFVPNGDPASKVEIDHLDNDRANDNYTNLEWVTPAEQQRRRAARMCAAGKTISQYIGVSWHHTDKKWIAQTVVNKRRKFIGNFGAEIDAAVAYNRYVRSSGLDHPLNELQA